MRRFTATTLVPLPLLLLLVLFFGVSAACSRRDALPGAPARPADLVAAIAALQQDAAGEPTNAANRERRSGVLWRWGNTFALEGGELPVNLPLFVTIVNLRRTLGHDDVFPTGIDITWDQIHTEIDRAIAELSLRERSPGALGTLAWATTAPVTAEDWVTLELVYSAGARGLALGGKLVFGRQFTSDHGMLQLEDPGADHYVSARSTRAGARLVPIKVPMIGIHGGFRSTAEMPGFALEGEPLASGDTVTFTLGDRSGGSRGLKMQSFTSDALLVPAYVDLAGNGSLMRLDWPPLTVSGRAVAGVSAVAPSIVAVGEPFELSVRAEDRLRDRPSGDIPAFDVLLGDRIVRQIPAGTVAITVLGDLTLEAPGVHRFTVRTSDRRLSAQSNPIRVEEAPGKRVFWGETHAHTGMAEGQGSPEAFYRYAREDARLDFVTLSEHDQWMDDAEWRTMQQLVRDHTQEGRFVSFLGYEWTAFRYRGGHHNVFFRTPDRKRVPNQEVYDLKLLYQRLLAENKPEDALVIPHAHVPGDWTTSDPQLERLVEIHSQHGTFEWFGNLYLRNGFELGFIAASDDHRSKPGYNLGRGGRSSLAGQGGLAAVLAESKTRDALFDALRSLSAYATTGERILVTAELNGHPMGTRQPDAKERRLRATVSGTAPIDRIEVVKNGTVVMSKPYLEASLGARVSAQVGFSSTSDVFGPAPDNPRGWRVWSGTLEVIGARVRSVAPIGWKNPHLARVEQDPERPEQLTFRTETRGRSEPFVLELEGATASTRLLFHLEPSREYGGGEGLVRPLADLPGDDFELRLGDLVAGEASHTRQVDAHVDRTVVQLVNRAGPLDQEFEFTDLGEPRSGDYYYLRVVQLDGARAWTSPFWVGGRAR